MAAGGDISMIGQPRGGRSLMDVVLYPKTQANYDDLKRGHPYMILVFWEYTQNGLNFRNWNCCNLSCSTVRPIHTLQAKQTSYFGSFRVLILRR